MLRIFIVSVLLFATGLVRAGEFAVSPLVINLDAQKSAKVPFQFTIKAKKGGDVKLSVFDLNQLETGHMGFVEGDESIKKSKANWITLEKDSFKLKTDEYVVASGYVKVPAKEKGSHLAAIMVEEVKDEKDKKGIEVNVRYAVVLKIDTQKSARRVRVKTEFNELTQMKTEQGWIFEAWFENQSQVEGILENELQLRDENRSLVGTVTMKTLSAWQRGELGSIVYPGSKVKVFGTLKEPLEDGSYSVRVRNKFNGRNQPLFRENIEINVLELDSIPEESERVGDSEVAQASVQKGPDQATAEGSVN